MKELEIALTTYIALEHTQEECIGFKAAEERMYSEEEVIELLTKRCKHFSTYDKPLDKLLLREDLEWFEQFKK